MLKKAYRLVLILFLCFLFGFNSYGQETIQDKKLIKSKKRELQAKNAVDSTYIELFPKDRILVGIHGGGVDNRYILRDRENKKYFALSSSIMPSLGFHFKYKKLPNISFSLPLNLLSKNKSFITKGYSFGTHFQPTRLLFIDMYLFQITGLKLDEINKNDTLQSYHGSNSTNINIEMFIVFNNAKYSYKNAFLSGETQKRSSGSISLGFSYNFFNQRNEDILFASNLIAYKKLNYQKVIGFSFAPILGYMHTFVIDKNWYVGGGLFYGPNIHFGKSWYNSSLKSEAYLNLSSVIKAKFAAGYNSKKVLVKLIGHTGFYGYKPHKKVAFNNYLSDFRISFTYIL